MVLVGTDCCRRCIIWLVVNRAITQPIKRSLNKNNLFKKAGDYLSLAFYVTIIYNVNK
jgi:hypothetical protein